MKFKTVFEWEADPPKGSTHFEVLEFDSNKGVKVRWWKYDEGNWFVASEISGEWEQPKDVEPGDVVPIGGEI